MDDEIDISEEPEPKKDQKADKSQFSDLEKAEFSFKKQLGKQKQKYESFLADQKKAFASLQERLDKFENPDKYKEKFRENFQTDDEYIDYIVQQRMNKILDKQNEKAMKDREQEAREEKAREFIDKSIETYEARNDYFNTVKAAFDEGLQELMDKEKYVAEYIMRNPNGPRILYELAKDKEKVRQIYSQGDPISRLFELKMIEREILTNPAADKSNPNLQKAIGKPGISKETTTDIFSNKDDLKRFIRMR